MCVFSGRPYSDLGVEEADLRSKEMQQEQKGVERCVNVVTSPRAAARRLPIATSKCVSNTLFGGLAYMYMYMYPKHLSFIAPSIPLSPSLPPSLSHPVLGIVGIEMVVEY